MEEIKKRGRKPKYTNEEDRIKALRASWLKAQVKRKEIATEYNKIWRDNNRERVNELAREYERKRRIFRIELRLQSQILD